MDEGLKNRYDPHMNNLLSLSAAVDRILYNMIHYDTLQYDMTPCDTYTFAMMCLSDYSSKFLASYKFCDFF